MRTFIAIELSDDIRSALSQIQSHLKYAAADVKWVAKDNIHLTLKFLGEVSEDKIDEIKSALDEICSTIKPFELDLKDIGAFPSIGSPRVIWVGLDKGVKESTDLAKRIDESLSNLGFAKETRPFAAHLTLGRVRSAKNKVALKEKLESIRVQGTVDRVQKIILFKSALTPSGPIYSKLHKAEFSEQ